MEIVKAVCLQMSWWYINIFSYWTKIFNATLSVFRSLTFANKCQGLQGFRISYQHK